MKKMKLKKIVSGLLVGLMTVGVLAGCGGGSGNGSNGSSTGGDNTGSTTGSGDVLELTFYSADGTETDPWTDPVALALTEATGVKLKTEFPVGSDDQRIALMIAEQNFPDMIYAKGDAGSLIEAGVLIDLTDLIEEYGPNIKKMYGDELDKLKYSAEDPSIYQLSSYSVGGTSYTTSGNAQIQWAALKEAGYKIPQTLEEYEAMIKDYIASHPTTEDGLDTIGITLSAADWHWYITLSNPAGFIGAAAPDNGQWLVDENYNATYKFRDENVKEYFRWLTRMYDEGILDSEFATQTHEDYIAKLASGRVVAILDSDWDYVDAEAILKADGKVDKTYAPLPITLKEDQKAASLMYQGLTTGQGVAITTSCADPVAAIKFLDYICSDEGQVLVNWGIEGVNYFYDEDGNRYRTEEEIKEEQENKDYKKTTGVGYHNYPFPLYGDGVEDPSGNTYTTKSKDNVIAEYNDEQKAAVDAWGVELLADIFPQADEFEVPKYSALWAYTTTQELDEIADQLDEVAWPGLITCVIGGLDNFDANYDKMVDELVKVGVEKAEEIQTNIVKEKVSMVD